MVNPNVYTVDTGSATTSATVTVLLSIEHADTIRVHNFGTPDIYARVTLDGTNWTPGNILPVFTKAGGSVNTYLSTNEIGTLTGPYKGVAIMNLEAGSAKAAIIVE